MLLEKGTSLHLPSIEEITQRFSSLSLDEIPPSESVIEGFRAELRQKMILDTPLISESELAERFEEIRKPIYLSRVTMLSEKIYVLAKEKICFQGLGFIGYLNKMQTLVSSLKARGVQFFQLEGYYPSTAILPPFDDRVPWQVLHLACRLEFLSTREPPLPSLSQLRELIFDCLAAEEKFPECTRLISIILDLVVYVDLRNAISGYFAPIEYAFSYWREFGHGSVTSKDAIQEFLTGMGAYLHRFLDFKKELSLIDRASRQPNEITQKLANKSMVIVLVFVNAIDRAVAMFCDPLKTTERNQSYARLYAELEVAATNLGKNVTEIVLQRVDITSLLRKPQKLNSNPSLYPPFVVQALSDVDIQRVSSPEEYAKVLEPVALTTIVDECRAEYRRNKELEPAPKPRKMWEFLPPGLLLDTQKKLKIVSKHKRENTVIQKEISCFERVPLSSLIEKKEESTSSQNEEDVSNLPVMQSLEGKKAICDLSLAAPLIESKEAVRTMQSTSTTSQELSEEKDSDFPVRVNDGPNLSLRYIDHAGRWAVNGRDIFSEDPAYKSKMYSQGLKDEIRFRHAFGRALVPVVLMLGKRFVRSHPEAKKARDSYTMPGEIIRQSGSYEKVIFTISVNPETREIIHMYATKKTPLELISEYSKEGFFAVAEDDFEEKHSLKRRPSSSSYILPDDFSRVTEVTDDCITVTEKNGTVLRVFPFPLL